MTQMKTADTELPLFDGSLSTRRLAKLYPWRQSEAGRLSLWRYPWWKPSQVGKSQERKAISTLRQTWQANLFPLWRRAFEIMCSDRSLWMLNRQPWGRKMIKESKRRQLSTSARFCVQFRALIRRESNSATHDGQQKYLGTWLFHSREWKIYEENFRHLCRVYQTTNRNLILTKCASGLCTGPWQFRLSER